MTDPASAFPLPESGRGEDSDTFRLRVERWGPEVLENLRTVYGEGTESLLERCAAILAEGFAARPRELRLLDERRLLRPDWTQRPETVGYATDPESFAGTIAGVAGHLDYLAWMGVTHLGLDNGTHRWDDDGAALAGLESLTAETRRRGMSVGVDLVLSHVADDHPWVARARAGDPRYRAYFRIVGDRIEADAWERTAQRAAGASLFTWDDAVRGWVWTSHQPGEWELDWANPDVFAEFLALMVRLANRGVEGLLLAGVSRLWARMGTPCVDLPEVQHLLHALRAALRIAAPAVSLIAVGNSPALYLGTHAHHGQLADLAVLDALTVHSWSALASRNTRMMEFAIAALPPKPSGATWITRVRPRSVLRWRLSDDDARRASLDGHSHRAYLQEYYTGEFPGSFARGIPVPGRTAEDLGVAGTCASLAGLEAALEARDPFGVDDAIRRILLLHSVALGFGGLPLLAMGDEVGILNAPSGDGGAAGRPRMDWQVAARAGAAWESGEAPTLPDATAEVPESQWREAAAARLYADFQHLIAVRASTPHLHGAVESRVVPSPDSRLLILRRSHPLGVMVQVYNFSENTVELSCDLLRGHLGVVADERLTGYEYSLMPWTLSVDPYRALWLTQKV